MGSGPTPGAALSCKLEIVDRNETLTYTGDMLQTPDIPARSMTVFLCSFVGVVVVSR